MKQRGRKVSSQATVIAVILGVLALALVGCGGGGEAAESSQAHSLYVQSANGGTVKSHDGKLTLTLRDVSKTTTTFTDRPERRSGAISTAAFVRSFLDFFGGDPPNADLSSLEVGKGEFTVELRNPRYSRGADTLTYEIRRVGKEGLKLPQTLGPLSLFIDVGGPSWDTRLHFSLATDGDVCSANGFGGTSLYVRLDDDSAIVNAPHTWIVEPVSGSSYAVRVTGSEGILDFGTQVAEGANKNGTTTMVFDWTLSCRDSSGRYFDLTRVRTAASVPDSNLEANTARCALLDPNVEAKLNGTPVNPGPVHFRCNALTDSGFHTTAYFKFNG
jgi:hypothetical protein